MSTEAAAAHTGTLEQLIAQALNSHQDLRRWLLTAPAIGLGQTTPDELAVDDRCAFGHWLHHDVSWRLRKTWDYATVKKRHAEFHHQAGEVARMIAEGGAQRASDSMMVGQPFFEAHERFEAALREWFPRIQAQHEGTKH